jgi:hypothetical protein
MIVSWAIAELITNSAARLQCDLNPAKLGILLYGQHVEGCVVGRPPEKAVRTHEM